MAAGPSFAVETDSEETEEWFSDVLLHESTASSDSHSSQISGAPWYETSQIQSNVGILVRVHQNPERPVRPRVTELLFYALRNVELATARLRTPLLDSPQPRALVDRGGDEQDSADDPVNPVSLYALPLSSDLLYTSSKLLESPALPPGDARSQPHSEAEAKREPSPRKQDRLNDIFDEAAHRRKRTRGQGGRSISLAASRNVNSPTFPQLHAPDGRGSVKIDEDTRSQLSFSNVIPSVEALTTADERPSVSLAGTSESFNDTSIESRNKQAVSRTVMAGMRMHGLQQSKLYGKKTKGQKGQESHEADTQSPAEETEFKAVYHQTYKGTLFAFVRSSAVSAQDFTNVDDSEEMSSERYCGATASERLQTDCCPYSAMIHLEKQANMIMIDSQTVC